MAILRLFVVTAFISAVLYAVLWAYLRSRYREVLEEEWADAHPALSGESGVRLEFIARRMRDYDRALRMWLIALVLIMPLALMLLTAYLVNSQ